MSFDTGNPVPSSDGRDLSDNAETIDKFVDGATETTTTRTGKSVLTRRGLEVQYVFTAINGGVWAAGQIFTAFNQYMVFSGTAYKPRNSTTLPYVVGATPVGDANVEVVGNLSTAQGDARYDKSQTLSQATSDVAAATGQTVRISDRADALFDWVSGETPNTFDIVAHDSLPIQLKLRLKNVFNPLEFGAAGDGVDGVGGTDDTAVLQRVFSLTGEVDLVGRSYLTTGQINGNNISKTINGTFLPDFEGPGPYPAFLTCLRTTGIMHLRDVNFIAQNPADIQVEIAADGSDWTFTSRRYLIGFIGLEGSVIVGGLYKQLYTSFRIDGTFDPTKVTYVTRVRTEECGAGPEGVRPTFNIASCSNVFVNKINCYRGTELTIPSCKQVSITNSIIKLPNKPAIDIGGSSALGNESEEIVISNNIVYGRDPIVCERGAWKVKITDNLCVVTLLQPDGLGIGVTAGGTGTQNLMDVDISDNTIRLIGDSQGEGSTGTPIAAGIAVRNTETSGEVLVKRVAIKDNKIFTAAFIGIEVDIAHSTGLSGLFIDIKDNTIVLCQFGIRLERCTVSSVEDNFIRFTENATVMSICSNFTIKGNKTIGFTAGLTHHFFDQIQDGTNKLLVTDSNAAVDTEVFVATNYNSNDSLIYLESNVPGEYTAANLRVAAQSRVAKVATAGGFAGRVAVTASTATTIWKNFGAVEV